MAGSGYTNPDLLWSVEFLNGRLSDPSVRIVDTRPVHEYVTGHIPGAISLDVLGISLADTRPEPFAAFMSMYGYLMGSRGIGTDQPVIFYENNSGMRSARGFWICEYHGHKDVHVLDGGVDAWQSAGYAVSQSCDEVGSAEFISEPQVGLDIGYQEILDSLSRDEFVPLDTRSEGEHYGTTVRAARGGSVPGAVHIEYVNNLDASGRFKSGEELRSMYERAGIMPEQTIACY